MSLIGSFIYFIVAFEQIQLNILLWSGEARLAISIMMIFSLLISIVSSINFEFDDEDK